MRPLALVFLCIFAAAGSAQSVLLRFRPPVGKRVAYTMTMSMTQNVPGMAGPMRITQSLPFTVRAVSRKGTDTTVGTKTGQARVTLPSQMAAGKAKMEQAMSNLTTTAVVGELGIYKSAAGGAHSALNRGMGSNIMAGAQGIAFPTKALKVGDTWGTSLDMNKAMNGMMGGAMKVRGAIPVTYRLVALEKRGAATLARIAMTMKGKTAMDLGATKMTMAMNSTGTILVDAATGLLSEMTTKAVTDIGVGTAGQTMRQNLTVSLKAH